MCAALSFILYNTGKTNVETAAEAHRIEEEFTRLEKQIIETISDKNLVNMLLTDAFTFEEFQKLIKLPFGVIVYEGDSAAMWTNNFAMPVQAQMYFDDAPLFISERNGNYVLFKHDFPGDVRSIGYLPLQFQFGINNRYLNNIKAPGINISPQLKLSSRPAEGAYPVRSTSDNTIFYVKQDNSDQYSPNFSGWLFAALIVAFMTALILFYRLAELLAEKWKRIPAVIIFTVLITCLYMVIQLFIQQAVFSYIDVFDPHYYGSSKLADSIGDLLIKTIFLFSFAVFFSNRFHIRLPENWLMKRKLPLLNYPE